MIDNGIPSLNVSLNPTKKKTIHSELAATFCFKPGFVINSILIVPPQVPEL